MGIRDVKAEWRPKRKDANNTGRRKQVKQQRPAETLRGAVAEVKSVRKVQLGNYRVQAHTIRPLSI